MQSAPQATLQTTNCPMNHTYEFANPQIDITAGRTGQLPVTAAPAQAATLATCGSQSPPLGNPLPPGFVHVLWTRPAPAYVCHTFSSIFHARDASRAGVGKLETAAVLQSMLPSRCFTYAVRDRDQCTPEMLCPRTHRTTGCFGTANLQLAHHAC